jgi:hypothetical protein
MRMGKKGKIRYPILRKMREFDLCCKGDGMEEKGSRNQERRGGGGVIKGGVFSR